MIDPRFNFIICLFIFLHISQIQAQIQKGEIREGDVISSVINPGESHQYGVKLNKEQFAFFKLIQKGVDVVITTYDINGEKIEEFDSPNGKNGPEFITIISSTEGNYFLEIRPINDKEPTGEYELSIEKIESIAVTPNEQVDQLFAAWDNVDRPGAAVGIIKDGEFLYKKGYGAANLEYDIPNSASSVFRIGSTSKQFTAACIIILAEKGKLNLDDTLNEFYPEFPEYAKTITIRHLLNHTSGIRDYLTLAFLKGLGNDDFYTDKDVMMWLVNQSELNFLPGEEHLYSNSGYWLLGQIVNKVSGMNMADFAKKEIFEPLGMTNTHFHNDHTQIVKNRASGYISNSSGGYKISMTTLDMIGDGGIFTTIDDIKKWDDAFYDSDVLSKKFWSMMTQQGVLNNGETIDYASGLSISSYKGLKTVSHGGAFVGFRADLIRFPEQRFSVAIFANRADANPTRMGYKVADIYLKDEFIIEEKEKIVTPAEEASSPESTAFSFEQLAGVYELGPGTDLQISIENDSIHVLQNWNKVSYIITETSENNFQIPGNSTINFKFSELQEGFAQVLTVIQNGNPTVCKRKKEIDVTGINLEVYIGSYFSKELDCKYSLFVENDRLKVKVRNNDPINLDTYDFDKFVFQGSLFRFNRNNGIITGFDMDAGRVKNLGFVKE